MVYSCVVVPSSAVTVKVVGVFRAMPQAWPFSQDASSCLATVAPSEISRVSFQSARLLTSVPAGRVMVKAVPSLETCPIGEFCESKSSTSARAHSLLGT